MHNIVTELETVKVGGSNIIGLQKWVGPVPPTYNGSYAHVIYTTAFSIFSDLASDTGYAIIDPV